ncbi:hypothetical protein [Demequina capsici]|uniref:LppM domain-containing protein n=1 Tax=Demequina capsici TaxID=3075620 RepID=A0AA96F9N4_9MICO|nr:hypothetical protein [Demequina sp. OYTSA14]WNM24641.1 hypothetical protein RN606_00385 [Demequina sp. OYTSA14]
MRLAPALVLVLAAAAVATGPVAIAVDGPQYTFPDTCDADSIYNGSSDCVNGWIDIQLHEDGSATWMRETAYPRAAFEDYIAQYESWTGTTQEYLDDQLADTNTDTVTATSELTDDLLLVRITSELASDNEAALVGFSVADDGALAAAIPIAQVTGVSLVTLTAPGPVQTSNGTIAGDTVTWNADSMADLTELDATASATAAPAGLPAWIVPSGAGLLVLAGVAGVLGFARRSRSTRRGA